jgi:hypothetical protein
MATEVFGRHSLDPKHYENLKKKREHHKKEHDNGPKETSFAQKGGGKSSSVICHCCGKTGHYSKECQQKGKIPYKEWQINKTLQHMQDAADDTDADDEETDVSDDESTTSTTSKE